MVASKVDYVKLRAGTNSSNDGEEQVQVNQRNLIDKILARYATEWSTLRELIQNAADASAKRVVIRFETLPSRTVPVPNTADPSALLHHVLMNHTLARLLVSNDGEPFTASDWTRLKNIAEGNPDETKIGAFGVGFYSVFNDCDEPFVISAKDTMAFYWKGNSLFTRKGRVAQDQQNSDTCFILDYRNSTFPVPNLLSLCQFLSTSLTFVGLEKVELWLDDWKLLTLSKKQAHSTPVAMPTGMDTVTKEKMMKIVGVETRTGQIDASYLNIVGWATPGANKPSLGPSLKKTSDAIAENTSIRGLFSRITGAPSKVNAAAKKAAREHDETQQAIFGDLAGTSNATIFVRLTTAMIQTYCGRPIAQELERATKKAPPKSTRITVLTSPYDEHSASISAAAGNASKIADELFSSITPKEGRIFIGFRTTQTTGFRAHIAAPSLIPTVEREHIDLSARYVSSWNMEMLRAAGIVTRIAYASEMSSLREQVRFVKKDGPSGPKVMDSASAIPAALHIYQAYTRRESTPSSLVSQVLEDAFWDSCRSSIEILSTQGVLSSDKVRSTAENLSFIEGIPLVPKEIIEGSPEFLAKLHYRGYMSDMTLKDIKMELDSKALNEDQIREFLKWAAVKRLANELDEKDVQSLFEATIVDLIEPRAGCGDMTLLSLREIRSFVNNSGIPVDLPVPSSTIPFKLTRTLSRLQLLAFGWEELQVVTWIKFLLDPETMKRLPSTQHLTAAPEFAAQLLQVLSRQWEPMNQKSKTEIVELLSNKTIMPTKLGLRTPLTAYFPSIKLFDDLPTLKGVLGVKEKFLAALGVRKTVELSVVFDRLMTRTEKPNGELEGKWSHVDLIRYLVSVRDDIPKEDIERLRATAICTSESYGTEPNNQRLFKVSELYQPSDDLKALRLPVLKWPGFLRLTGPEGSFLVSLGLKKFPSVSEIVDLMVKAASTGQGGSLERALKYFIDFHHVNGYAAFDLATIQHLRFLPLRNKLFPEVSSPLNCFANEKAVVMGYDVLREDLIPHAMKFGVRTDPPMRDAANKLIASPPRTAAVARAVFGYFSGRLPEITPLIAEMLGGSLVVPILSPFSQKRSESSVGFRYTAPRMCFLGDPKVYGRILDFVDFGSDANSFLLKVGSKHEPTSVELAQITSQDPIRLLDTLGQEKYLDLLRKLAENQSALKSDKELWQKLKRRPCLLGYRDVPEMNLAERGRHSSVTEKAAEGLDFDTLDDDDLSIREWSLAIASTLIIVDSIEDFTLFRNSLLASPQEESLETFYSALGAPALSSLVEVERRVGRQHQDQSVAQKLRKLIIERSRIFLHEHHGSKIFHDDKWLEKNLAVQIVQNISVRKTLRGYNVSHSEHKSAALGKDPKGGVYVLSVSRSFDLYEVSQVLIALLLRRAKHQDIMALEMILNTDLKKLKARGFNVDRILRQQAIESRIAEDRRRKLLEDERLQAAQEQVAAPKPKAIEGVNGIPSSPREPVASAQTGMAPSSGAMPGSFGDDSPARMPQSRGNPVSSGSSHPEKNPVSDFFSNISKRFGLDDTQKPHDILHHAGDQGDQVDFISSPQALENNLVSAIQSCRSHDSKTLFSAPETTTIREAEGAYCDSNEGHDLTVSAETVSGMKVYMPRQMYDTDPSAFLRDNTGGLNSFAFMLLDCGSVFNLSPQSLHIFYNPSSKAIAFNQNGSIFCNYHFFSKLQLGSFQNSQARADTAVYWFVVLCHELAHNLVSAHDSKHSFYTESFVQQYFRKMVAKAAQY